MDRCGSGVRNRLGGGSGRCREILQEAVKVNQAKETSEVVVMEVDGGCSMMLQPAWFHGELDGEIKKSRMTPWTLTSVAGKMELPETKNGKVVMEQISTGESEVCFWMS